MVSARIGAWLGGAMTAACLTGNAGQRATPDPARPERAPATSTVAGASPAPPFAPDSPINLAIPPSPVVDPASAAQVAYLSRRGGAHVGLFEFGIPIWDADEHTGRVTVSCSREPEWGPCPFTGLAVPMPAAAKPHTGSDGALVVVDRSAGKSYEFWQFRREGAGFAASWGAVQELRGSGFGKHGSSTAAGASRLAGVVRVHEIEQGRIPHALVMAIDNACEKSFRAPAWKTDGNSTRSDCTPQGTRLQLDPAIELDTLSGLSRGERTIARALQEFGAYVIDKGGAPMGFSFELARDARSTDSPGAVYTAAGLPWDYYHLPHIPWSRLRALRSWDGR